MLQNRSEVYTDGEKTATYDAALTAAGCEKAVAFVNFCNAFEIPVLTLVKCRWLQELQMQREEDREGGSTPDLRIRKR